MKFRTFFFIVLLVFSTNTVTEAANISLEGTNEFNISYDFPQDEELLFQYALELGLVNYPPPELKKEPEKYTVLEGDNLYRIALKHDIPLESLIIWNDLRGDLIHPGDELIVSDGDSETGVVQKKPDRKVAAVSTPIVTSPPVASKPIVVSPPTEIPVEVEVAEEIVVTATAYTAYCAGCSGTTAYGIDLRSNPNQKVIAVDPRVIPLGTRVWVEGYGEAIAGDTGGAIKGNKIDVFIPSYDNAMQWGVKKVRLKVLN